MNPSELLNTPRIEQLINEAKNEYDYVLIDARSIDLAHDTFLLVKHVDMTLLVCKAGKLMTDELKTIRSYSFSKRLGNMQVVFNEFKKNISNKSTKKDANLNWKDQLRNKIQRIIKRK